MLSIQTLGIVFHLEQAARRAGVSKLFARSASLRFCFSVPWTFSPGKSFLIFPTTVQSFLSPVLPHARQTFTFVSLYIIRSTGIRRPAVHVSLPDPLLSSGSACACHEIDCSLFILQVAVRTKVPAAACVPSLRKECVEIFRRAT